MLPKTKQEFELRVKRRQAAKDNQAAHTLKQLDDGENRKLFAWGMHKDEEMEQTNGA